MILLMDGPALMIAQALLMEMLYMMVVVYVVEVKQELHVIVQWMIAVYVMDRMKTQTVMEIVLVML